MTDAEKKAKAAADKRARYAANPEKYKTATRRYRQANPEKVNAAARRRYAKGGETARRRRTLEKYRITAADFERLWTQQGGRCPICFRELTRAGGRSNGAAVIDHDHDTDHVRGLLCHGCNVQVGFIEKSTARAIRAVEYVLKHTEEQLDTAEKPT